MYEWKETRTSIVWIRIGETLIHLDNVLYIIKKDDGCSVRFSDGKTIDLPGAPVQKVAELIGFKEIKDEDDQ